MLAWLTDLDEKRRHCRVHERGTASLSSERLAVEGVAGAGLERRAEGVLRDPEGLKIGIGKDAVENSEVDLSHRSHAPPSSDRPRTG
ncbi:hypothetical protein GCM10010381_65220 [Streptomyces xantholiticus]|nr:hypothetical protein GCM10010381_65220 [Streptomyces xantholiticus]